jgi:hypothetical protein
MENFGLDKDQLRAIGEFFVLPSETQGETQKGRTIYCTGSIEAIEAPPFNPWHMITIHRLELTRSEEGRVVLTIRLNGNEDEYFVLTEWTPEHYDFLFKILQEGKPVKAQYGYKGR